MKQAGVLAAVLAGVLLGAAATAAPYVEGSAGITIPPKLDLDGFKRSMNAGYNFGGSVGTSLRDELGARWSAREDVLYTHNRHSCCAAHLSGLSFMTDAIYRFDTNLPFNPYIGLGIGGIDVQYAADDGPHGSQVEFGGQVIGGVEVPLSRQVSAFGEYRFIDVGKARMGFGAVQYKSHAFTFGLKIDL